MTGTRTGLTQGLAALKDPRFRGWFLTQSVSGAGSIAQSVGQAWLVLQHGGGAIPLALVSGALFLPTLLLGAPVGLLSDRIAPRRILVVTTSLQAILASFLALLVLSGHINLGVLIAGALAAGVCMAFEGPGRQILILDLVGPRLLASAVGLNEIMINSSRILGPAMAGALLVLVGPGPCFLLNAATFVPALVLLLLWGRRSLGSESIETTGSRPGLAQMLSGLVSSWRDPSIRVCLLFGLLAGAVINVSVVVPLLITQTLHQDAGALGLTLSFFGVGAIPGAYLASLGRGRPSLSLIGVSALATALATAVAAQAPSVPLLAIAMAVVGLTSIWLIALANTYVLLSADEHLRGRVMGAWSMALPGSIPATSLIFGVAAEAYGPRDAYTGLAVLTAVAAAASFLVGRRPSPAVSQARLDPRPATYVDPDAGEATPSCQTA